MRVLRRDKVGLRQSLVHWISSLLTTCDYREENQAAREKKALAKANRTKAIKSSISQPRSALRKDDKKAAPKRKHSKIRRNSSSSPESSITPEPIHYMHRDQLEAATRPRLHIEPAYTHPPPHEVPMIYSTHQPTVDQEDVQSASDGTDTYFGYLSSSTTSLQSSMYESAYAQDRIQYTPSNQDYHISPNMVAQEPPYYQSYHAMGPETKAVESVPALSYPMESPQPSGLCLYLSPDEPHFTNPYPTYATSSNPTTPSIAQNYGFPNPSPPLYHGPIDWNSRPLAPFQHTAQAPLAPSQYYQRPRSYSDLPMYTQTVSMDQICRAGV